MKQNPKPFSVEIKKSRVQGQRNHLPPRRLFATAPAEATKTFLKEEPQVVAEPSAAPRILPSIVEPMWSSSEPVEPVRCKRSSGETGRDQIEFDLAASASEDMEDTPMKRKLAGAWQNAVVEEHGLSMTVILHKVRVEAKSEATEETLVVDRRRIRIIQRQR